MKAEQLIAEIGANYAISNATKASLATRKIEEVLNRVQAAVRDNRAVPGLPGSVSAQQNAHLARHGEPQDTARITVERAGFRQCQDVHENVAPGARRVKPDAEDIRLVQRYLNARACLVAPLHRVHHAATPHPTAPHYLDQPPGAKPATATNRIHDCSE
jgi:hypothetical protein